MTLKDLFMHKVLALAVRSVKIAYHSVAFGKLSGIKKLFLLLAPNVNSFWCNHADVVVVVTENGLNKENSALKNKNQLTVQNTKIHLNVIWAYASSITKLKETNAIMKGKVEIN